jgi:hypothetical protein
MYCGMRRSAGRIVLEGCRYADNRGAPSGNVPPSLRVIGSGNYHGVMDFLVTARSS